MPKPKTSTSPKKASPKKHLPPVVEANTGSPEQDVDLLSSFAAATVDAPRRPALARSERPLGFRVGSEFCKIDYHAKTFEIGRIQGGILCDAAVTPALTIAGWNEKHGIEFRKAETDHEVYLGAVYAMTVRMIPDWDKNFESFSDEKRAQLEFVFEVFNQNATKLTDDPDQIPGLMSTVLQGINVWPTGLVTGICLATDEKPEDPLAGVHSENICKAIARAFYVSAWAHAGGNHGPSALAEETAPPTSPEASSEARKAALALVELNCLQSLDDLVLAAAQADDKPDLLEDPEKATAFVQELGWDLGMEMLRSGVSWRKDHASFAYATPHIEFHMAEAEIIEANLLERGITAKDLEVVVQELASGLARQEMIDESVPLDDESVVVSAYERVAADVNEGGLYAQVAYLVENLGRLEASEVIESHLRGHNPWNGFNTRNHKKTPNEVIELREFHIEEMERSLPRIAARDGKDSWVYQTTEAEIRSCQQDIVYAKHRLSLGLTGSYIPS